MPSADFKIGEIYTERTGDGQPKVIASVGNTGRRSVGIDGKLELSAGPSGRTSGPFQVASPLALAPGESGTLTVVLADDVSTGPWTFRLVLHSGKVSHSARGTLSFPEKPAGFDLEAVVDLPMPLALAGSGVLAGIGVIVLLALGLRRIHRRPTYHDAT